jgi:hypothetical protein
MALGKEGAHLVDVGRSDLKRRDIGFGEKAVVHGFFLATHDASLLGSVIEEAGLLMDAFSPVEASSLTLPFIIQSGNDFFEGVKVFDFDLGPKLWGSMEAKGDVGVASEASFLHVAFTHPRIAHATFKALEVVMSFLGGPDLGHPYNLDERHACTVEVNVGMSFCVNVLTCIFFEVDAFEGNGFSTAEADASSQSEWEIILADLVALGEIGIVVMLTVEFAMSLYLAFEGKCCEDS